MVYIDSRSSEAKGEFGHKDLTVMLFKLISLLGLASANVLQAHASVKESRSWHPHFDDLVAGIQQTAVIGPVGGLHNLSTSGFTTLKHAAFPKYGVRVKKSKFCDGTVEYVLKRLRYCVAHFVYFSAYTGYIDVEAKHLFFYFFESRDDPDKDDVIFWTNGGPGCSSAMGLFMELGQV